MRRFTILIPLIVVSCVSQMETMKRHDGSTYSYIYNQLGGAGNAKSSSGTKVQFDGQASLADFFQAVGTSITSLSYKAIKLGEYEAQRFTEGQITRRQLDANLTKIKELDLAGKLDAYKTSVNAGAPLGEVTAPKL